MLLCGYGCSELPVASTLPSPETSSLLVRVDWPTGIKNPQNEPQVRSIKIQVTDLQIVITRPGAESVLTGIPTGKHMLQVSVHSNKDGSGVPQVTVSQAVTIRTEKTELFMTVQRTTDRVILSLRLLVIKDEYRSFLEYSVV